jgi:hypothetical protein
MNIYAYENLPKIENLIDFPQKYNKTENPNYFVIPKIIFVKDENPMFFNKIKELCYSLEHWNKKEKHVFFIGGGKGHQFDFLRDCITFQHSCHIESKDLAYPYFTNDEMKTFKYVRTINNCEYACSFMGCLNTHPVRFHLENALKSINANTYFEKNDDYFEFLPNQVRIDQAKKYRTLINNSMFFLCPRGYGVNSLRFFETLSFGRIPVLISDATKLPLEKTIDYSKFTIRLPEKEIHKLPDYIMKFMDENDMKVASKLARDTWTRYFRLGSFPLFLELALREI